MMESPTLSQCPECFEESAVGPLPPIVCVPGFLALGDPFDVVTLRRRYPKQTFITVMLRLNFSPRKLLPTHNL